MPPSSVGSTDALSQYHGLTLTIAIELIKPEQETPAQAATVGALTANAGRGFDPTPIAYPTNDATVRCGRPPRYY